jgi:SMC interacting uncharacterized protein involved in chromosome segregation
MWEKLIGWLRFLWDAGKETQENGAAIQELDANQRVLIELVRTVLSQQDTLRAENAALRQALEHERELREREIANLKLELRLQISEELRRLPPAGEQ